MSKSKEIKAVILNILIDIEMTKRMITDHNNITSYLSNAYREYNTGDCLTKLYQLLNSKYAYLFSAMSLDKDLEKQAAQIAYDRYFHKKAACSEYLREGMVTNSQGKEVYLTLHEDNLRKAIEREVADLQTAEYIHDKIHNSSEKESN